MNPTRFLKMPPAKVQAAVDRMSMQERHALAKHLSDLLETAAWKFGYVEQRHQWDDAHDSAVRRANKMLRSVRKEIGFTLPAASAISV